MVSPLMVSIVATLISFAQPQAIQNKTELSVQQTECLTEAIYFESRGEGTIGGAAVSYVVQNRSALEGKSYCEIVHEKGQFSFYNSHKTLHVHETAAWTESAKIAVGSQIGLIANPIGNATYYNTVPVRSWNHLLYVKKVEHQYFYRSPKVLTKEPLTQHPWIMYVLYGQTTPVQPSVVTIIDNTSTVPVDVKKSNIKQNYLRIHRVRNVNYVHRSTSNRYKNVIRSRRIIKHSYHRHSRITLHKK